LVIIIEIILSSTPQEAQLPILSRIRKESEGACPDITSHLHNSNCYWPKCFYRKSPACTFTTRPSGGQE
jgi:hypothetical protein